MKKLHMLTFLLLLIGGVNWLLVGVFGWDVGELFGGQDAVISRIVYVLVGLAAVYELIMHKSLCSCCDMCGEKKEKPVVPPMSGMDE